MRKFNSPDFDIYLMAKLIEYFHLQVTGYFLLIKKNKVVNKHKRLSNKDLIHKSIDKKLNVYDSIT